MGGSVAVKNRHLNIHEYNVRFGMCIRFRLEEVVEGFSAVPYCIDREAELPDGLQSDLLIDLAVSFVQGCGHFEGAQLHLLVFNDQDVDL